MRRARRGRRRRDGVDDVHVRGEARAGRPNVTGQPKGGLAALSEAALYHALRYAAALYRQNSQRSLGGGAEACSRTART